VGGNNHVVTTETIASDGSQRWAVSPLSAVAAKGREGV